MCLRERGRREGGQEVRERGLGVRVEGEISLTEGREGRWVIAEGSVEMALKRYSSHRHSCSWPESFFILSRAKDIVFIPNYWHHPPTEFIIILANHEIYRKRRGLGGGWRGRKAGTHLRNHPQMQVQPDEMHKHRARSDYRYVPSGSKIAQRFCSLLPPGAMATL